MSRSNTGLDLEPDDPKDGTEVLEVQSDLHLELDDESRLKKIVSIRDAIAEGTYHVDAAGLADAILRKALLDDTED